MPNDLYLEAMRAKGAADAADFQQRSAEMDGTQMYEEEEKIPDFSEAVKIKNMLERQTGFICKSSAGRIVKLIQPYDSNIYTSEPEELPAQWGYYWSKDPRKALPFIAQATSPYMTGDCCTDAGHVWQAKQDNVVWAPSTNPEFWTDLGTIESVMGV